MDRRGLLVIVEAEVEVEFVLDGADLVVDRLAGALVGGPDAFRLALACGNPRGHRGARHRKHHRAIGIEVGGGEACGLLELGFRAGQDVGRRLGTGTRGRRDGDFLFHLELEAGIARRLDRNALDRRGGNDRTRRLHRAIGKHRIGRIELAAQRHGLLPDLALAVAHGIELGCHGLEGRRLVVLRVDLEELEIDLLPLRILLERVLEDFLGLGIAAVGQVDLGFRDGIDLVGIDVAEALAAEVARERVVTGIDHATAGRAEHGVGLDVGARDDAVLELGRLAAAGGKERDEAGDEGQHTCADGPAGRARHQVLEEARRLLGRRLRRGLGGGGLGRLHDLGRFGDLGRLGRGRRGGRAPAAASRARRPWAARPGSPVPASARRRRWCRRRRRGCGGGGRAGSPVPVWRTGSQRAADRRGGGA